MRGGVLVDVELELVFFRLGTGSEDGDVGGVGLPLIFDESLLEFVAEFKVASG